MTLILNDDDVSKALNMKDCVDVLESAFRDMGEGATVNASRRDSFMASHHPNAYYSFKTIEGGSERLGVMAQRINSDLITYPEVHGAARRVKVPIAPGNRYVGLVFLYSSETLELLAIMNDGHLQRMRVAGTTGVGAQHLARRDAHVVALFGSGWQAETAAWALAAVRPLTTIRVFSPDREHRESFCRKMASTLGIEVIPKESADRAVRGADIVATATNAHGSVVQGEWVEPGMHLTSIKRMEFDDEAWQKSNLIVFSSHGYSSIKSENPVLHTIRSGQDGKNKEEERLERYRRKTYFLSELLMGRAPGRSSSEEITMFNKSTGLGIEFAYVGKLVYDNARAAGLGREIPTDWFSQTSHP